MVCVRISVVQQVKFHPHQNYEHVDVNKQSRLYIIGRSLRDGKVTTYLQLAQNCNFHLKLDKNSFFHQHAEPPNDVMQRDIDILELLQSVNFEIIESLKNNSTKYLLIIDKCCEQMCKWKKFVGIAPGGRHRGLSTIFIKHNLFIKANMGERLSSRNAHCCLQTSPWCDATQHP